MYAICYIYYMLYIDGALYVDHRFGDARLDGFVTEIHLRRKKNTHKMGLSIYDLHIYVYMYMYLGLARIYSRYMYITVIYMYLLFIYIGLTRALHVHHGLRDASFNRFVTKVHLRSREGLRVNTRCMRIVSICDMLYMLYAIYRRSSACRPPSRQCPP